jgi:hypothetical protein
MKTCPFCKNIIELDSDTCPQCRRVLVERVNSNTAYRSTASSHEAKTSAHKQSKDAFKQYWKRISGPSLSDFKKYLPIVALLLVIVLISLQEDRSVSRAALKPPVPVIPQGDAQSVELSDSSAFQAKKPIVYASLPNGKVLSRKQAYFNGPGRLEINNGTSLDAVAKLVNVSVNSSVLTVYIKANSTYEIKDVSDGNYKLFFNLGNDWDDKSKAFAVNSSYEVFEEDFDFTTSEYEDDNRIHTRYATFSVTLNPVIGGQAKTEDVNAAEFGAY